MSLQFLSVQTPATGSQWASFPSLSPISQLIVKNNTGTTILLSVAGANSKTLPVLDGEAWPVTGLTNANQLQLQRQDQSNTQVTVYAQAEGP